MLVKVEEKRQWCHIKKNGVSTSLVHVQRNMDYLESSDFLYWVNRIDLNYGINPSIRFYYP